MSIAILIVVLLLVFALGFCFRCLTEINENYKNDVKLFVNIDGMEYPVYKSIEIETFKAEKEFIFVTIDKKDNGISHVIHCKKANLEFRYTDLNAVDILENEKVIK